MNIDFDDLGDVKVGRMPTGPIEEEDYRGYSIRSFPLPTTGSASGHWFGVDKGGELAFEVAFKVTYSQAVVAQEAPEVLAERFGRRHVHGLIDLNAFELGARYEVMRDSYWEPNAQDEHTSDGELRLAVLYALRRMVETDHEVGYVQSLDVEGLAEVLQIQSGRLRSLLSLMSVEGLVEGYAENFGHTLEDGACRITASGLQELSAAVERGDRLPSTPERAGAVVSPDVGSPISSDYSPPTPSVFVSYSHDSPQHLERVRSLAGRLRDNGVECEIDQYEGGPSEGWPNWMARRINDADWVLVICTPTYHRRVTGEEADGVGRGAKYEGLLINQEIFEAGGQNDRFLPVVFEPGHTTAIPAWLQAFTHYDLSNKNGYEGLYRRITRQPLIERPPLGQIVPMPPVSTNQRLSELPRVK